MKVGRRGRSGRKEGRKKERRKIGRRGKKEGREGR